MSNFFNKSDLTRQDADKLVSETLNNCDDGELYLEESKSESILLDDNKIKSSNYSSDLGFGFRAISNEVVAYSYSNEISKDSFDELKDPLQPSESATGEQQKSKSSQKKLVDAFGASDRIMSPPKKVLLTSGKEERFDSVVAEKTHDIVDKFSPKHPKNQKDANGGTKYRKRPASRLNVEQKVVDDTKEIKTFEWIG